MNSYYLTLVLKPDMEEKVRKELLEGLKKKFDKVIKEDLWGLRDLAYPIKKQTKG
ncbi:MAG: 30S ribosomal protein S6, partial [Candidatus Daviesbacteria bacterium GW2011_GWF2_38_6]